VAEALEQSREALAELRAVSRGIAPPILVDRGLGAALAAAAARCPVPVSLDVDLDGRLPDVVEQTAYFVVAEALTNVAKHSGAAQAAVIVDSDGERMRVRVTDDGRARRTRARGTASRGSQTGSRPRRAGSTCSAPRTAGTRPGGALDGMLGGSAELAVAHTSGERGPLVRREHQRRTGGVLRVAHGAAAV